MLLEGKWTDQAQSLNLCSGSGENLMKLPHLRGLEASKTILFEQPCPLVEKSWLSQELKLITTLTTDATNKYCSMMIRSAEICQ